MQSEEDKKIQSKLESAGNGLPKFEAFFIRHIGFPILKTIVSWNMGMTVFEYSGEKILTAVKKLDNDTLFKKVLIPKVFGIEDNSRYYSPAMVLWHLIYVGETIKEGIIGLSKGEKLYFTVKIANFKPFVKIGDNIVGEYEAFIKSYRNETEVNVKSKYLDNSHAHPWFGELNPHQWLIISAIHQFVHCRQMRKILLGNK